MAGSKSGKSIVRPMDPSSSRHQSSNSKYSASGERSSRNARTLHSEKSQKMSRSSFYRDTGFLDVQGMSSGETSGSGSKSGTPPYSPAVSGGGVSDDDVSSDSNLTEVAGPMQLTEAFIASIIRLNNRLRDFEQIIELAVDFEKECGGLDTAKEFFPYHLQEFFTAYDWLKRGWFNVQFLRDQRLGTENPGLVENAVQAIFNQVEEYRKQNQPDELPRLKGTSPSDKHSRKSSKKIDQAQLLAEQQKHVEHLKALILGLKLGHDEREEREDEIKSLKARLFLEIQSGIQGEQTAESSA